MKTTVVGVLLSIIATGWRHAGQTSPVRGTSVIYGLGLPVSSPCKKKWHLGHSRVTEVSSLDVSRRCLMKVKQDGQMTKVGGGSVGAGSGIGTSGIASSKTCGWRDVFWRCVWVVSPVNPEMPTGIAVVHVGILADALQQAAGLMTHGAEALGHKASGPARTPQRQSLCRSCAAYEIESEMPKSKNAPAHRSRRASRAATQPAHDGAGDAKRFVVLSRAVVLTGRTGRTYRVVCRHCKRQKTWSRTGRVMGAGSEGGADDSTARAEQAAREASPRKIGKPVIDIGTGRDVA